MIRIIAGLLFCTVANISLAGTPFITAYAGNWHGVGVQTDGSDWDMLVTIDQEQGVVSYPSLRCGGRWHYLKKTDSNISAIEIIEYGLENCIETGNVYLQPWVGDRMIFMWCGEAEGVSAIAVLERNSPGVRGYTQLLEASMAALDAQEKVLESITCPRNQWLGV